jgi:hypothetical protein
MSDRLLCRVPCCLCRTTLSHVSQSDVKSHICIIWLSMTDRVSKFYNNHINEINIVRACLKYDKILSSYWALHIQEAINVTVPQSQNGGRKSGGGFAPHFLNLSISLRWVLSFTLLVPFSWRTTPQPLDRGLGGPWSYYGNGWGEKFPCLYWTLIFLQAQLGTVLTELSKLIGILIWKMFCAGVLL